ncbi:MAG: peptidylprolyl isomerase, partial [Bacteroidota bacterium]
HLDDQYTVFGEVIEGLEIIDKIARVEVDHYNRPVEDIRIKMRIIR